MGKYKTLYNAKSNWAKINEKQILNFANQETRLQSFRQIKILNQLNYGNRQSSRTARFVTNHLKTNPPGVVQSGNCSGQAGQPSCCAEGFWCCVGCSPSEFGGTTACVSWCTGKGTLCQGKTWGSPCNNSG